MTLTESEKSDIVNALRKVKTNKVAEHLGLQTVAHGKDYTTFINSEHNSDNGSSPGEVNLPHWLVDKIHAGIK
jgi:hypothetical protein